MARWLNFDSLCEHSRTRARIRAKISAHSRNAQVKKAIFALILDFWRETPGVLIALIRAILDGFKNFF